MGEEALGPSKSTHGFPHVVSALKGEENLRAPEREEGPSHSYIPVYSPFPFFPQE